MKPFLENIYHFARRPVLQLLVATFCCLHASAQNDTASLPPSPDSSNVVETIDTGEKVEDQRSGNIRKTEYFDRDTRRDDTIDSREVSTRVIDSLKAQDAFWYVDKDFRSKDPVRKFDEQKPRKRDGQWMNMSTLVVIVVIFIGGLVWFLYRQNIGKQRKDFVNAQGEEEVAPENIFDINYDAEIQKAVGALDYRLATRLWFLRSLRDLSLKNIIQYKQDRTNMDYLQQLSSGRYYSDFFRLARNYEYVWYGQLDIAKAIYEVIARDFETFNEKLG